jgi:hypothetical protein
MEEDTTFVEINFEFVEKLRELKTTDPDKVARIINGMSLRKLNVFLCFSILMVNVE